MTKAVHGVRGVANDIKVQIVGSSMRTDEQLALAALNAIEWDLEVPHDHISVLVSNGVITLERTVDWEYQKLDKRVKCRLPIGFHQRAAQAQVLYEAVNGSASMCCRYLDRDTSDAFTSTMFICVPSMRLVHG